MNLPVLTLGTAAVDFVSGLERLHGPVTVVRRCTELAELLAAAQSGLARAAIVAGQTQDLDGGVLERLHSAEVSVVALTDDDGERLRLQALGIRTGAETVEPAVLAALVAESAAQLQGAWPPARTAAGTAGPPLAGLADPARALEPRIADPVQAGPPAADGGLVAVWGPAGAPGRTTVAVNLAAEYAASGQRTLLVDADTYGASVAAFLGLLDESAALAHACRMADQGVLDREAFERVCLKVAVTGTSLRVLTGITRVDRWTELRPSALGTVLTLARAVADVVVVDCGFSLEHEEELSFDSMAPRRNGATLRVLELADRVLAVGSADSIGMPRLVRALDELGHAVPSASAEVVLNKVRAAAVGPRPEAQLREAWERFGPVHEIRALLPADPAAADAALLGGSVLLEAAPDSALRHAIAALSGSRLSAPRRGLRRRALVKVKF
ncbi:chromosome partitioning protein [Arthrobacter sp.]|uniref:AAA family ATPase n=1 Tax=Arthrobacter sp. TaxID=1667 RepID=UPI00339271E2